jgi:uncharacterized protein YhaN
MIIKDVHIDNYGKYSGRGFSGFTAGVNVVYGPNEHGKTTLLEFIRRMFFGFPPKTYRKNRFVPVNAAPPGGRLLCVTDSGREIRIERQGWTKGGALKLDSKDAVQQELNELLRASELFYRNVYAITIDELFSMDALNGEEIKNRIYGAGLDLGGVSLAKIKKQFQADADKIFKPGGSKQLINLLNSERKEIEQQIKDAEQNLSSYETILREKGGNKEKISEIEGSIKTLAAQSSELESKCAALSEFVEYESFEEKLKSVPECAEVTQDDIEQCRDLQTALEKAVAGENSTGETIRQLEDKINAAVVNNKLLEHRSRIKMLERASERYRAERENINSLTAKIEKLENNLAAVKNNIASLWQNGGIPDDYCFGLEFVNKVREFENQFSDIQQQVIFLENLRLQQAQMPQAKTTGNIVPALVLFGIFAAATVAAGIFLPLPLAAVVIITVCIPVSIIIAKGFGKKKEKPEKSQRDIIEEQRSGIAEHWKELLQDKGFKQDLSPAAVLAGVDEYKDFSRDSMDLEALRKELENKKTWIGEIDSEVEKVAETLDAGVMTSDTRANIEIISNTAKENEKTFSDYENCQAELKKLKLKSETDNDIIKSRKAALADFLGKFKAGDFADLRTMLKYTDKRVDFTDKLQDSWNRLKKIFGLEAQIADIRILLKTFSREEAMQQIEELKTQKSGLEKELAKLNQEQGALTKEEEMLVSTDQLTRLHNRHETCVQRIRDHAGRWARFRTAELLINRAVSKYEAERQPEVITHAGAIFDKLTDGEYVSIRKPAESDELLLVGADGSARQVLELSRGTREQLYLAMRLGLIAQYEENTESLPLVFDDILVNFDKKRLKTGMETIFKFARERQVILLTCHENIHQLALKYGAADIPAAG